MDSNSSKILSYFGISGISSELGKEFTQAVEQLAQVCILDVAKTNMPEEKKTEFANLLAEGQIDDALALAERDVPDFQDKCQAKIKEELAAINNQNG